MRYHTWLAPVALWAGLAADAAAQGNASSDRAALEALYDATGGPGWTDSTNWKTSAPIGEWFGVTTDTAGRVTELNLSGNELTGPIPAALGDLELLQTLILARRWDPTSRQWFPNALTGPIPDELGRLENLSTLLLGGNELTGRIPDTLGNLANLWALRLDSNALTGPVPASLGNLTGLRSLILGGNELTGPIPRELERLVNLEWLILWGNELTGPVPAGLGNLTALRELHLGGNALTGPIPSELGRLVNLEWLRLWNNTLTGPIPAGLGNLTALRELYLSGNALTGPIPSELGRLVNLEWLRLWGNGLTGPVPAGLGNLTALRELHLGGNALTGPIPSALGSLENLERLNLSYNWGLSGPLPSSLQQSRFEQLDIFVTQACAPAASRDWLATIEFLGRVCGSRTDVTIDVAVVYTPAVRAAMGGAAVVEAEIDLMVAETNQAYAASGVHHRLALVQMSEVAYTETGDSSLDLRRLADPADGHMDAVHASRDQLGADLVHLMVSESDFAGIANLAGAFSYGVHRGGGLGGGAILFAHELGHNLGLSHDRYSVHGAEPGAAHPAYGYVNQRALEAGSTRLSHWNTAMAYGTQCGDAGFVCGSLLRFSNPRQSYNGDPLGIPFGEGSGVTGPADAAAVLNATGPAVAAWRDRPNSTNRPPAPAGTLPDRLLILPGTLDVDVSQAFVDPDGDALTYAVSSSAPSVVTLSAAGARVTLTAVSAGTATIRVTAMDPGGLSAAQEFTVSVSTGAAGGFTDDPLQPGVTPVRAIHFTELRTRIDALREAAGLGRFRWTDPALKAGATPVRLVHLTELREALGAAYTAARRAAPRWTDAAPVAGSTPIRAAHLTELRAAVVALE